MLLFSVQAWLSQFNGNIVDFLFALNVQCLDKKTPEECLKV
jgi:hypothetical protein